MVFAMQLLSGQNLIGQGVQFLQQAGIGNKLSFDLNMVLNSVSLYCSSPISVCLISHADVRHWNHFLMGM